MISSNNYLPKEVNYFSNVRVELLDLIPQKNKGGLLLEIGAGSGDTLLIAKKNGFAKYVAGVELCEIENSYQTNPEIDKFVIGNIEELEFESMEHKYDVILCGDVLEHLIDPYMVVAKLKKYLKKDGVLITSIPNIRYWTVMRDILLKGDFRYSCSGILDKTHLRFFCKKSIEDLFVNSEMEILKNVGNIHLIGGKSALFNKLTLGVFEEFLSTQYFTVSKKA